MCAAARSTPRPDRREIPVLDSDDIGADPTVRAEFSFGHFTIPMMSTGTPGLASPANSIVKPFPRVPTPVPSANAYIPTPMIAPPPSAPRGIALGFAIGTTLGLAILGVAWQFFL